MPFCAGFGAAGSERNFIITAWTQLAAWFWNVCDVLLEMHLVEWDVEFSWFSSQL